jgi:1-deoxy-D-xylulose-5-phosphate synthase
MGGAGSAVQEFCSHKNIEIKSKLFGIPDTFIEHASREEMIEDAGINASQILDSLNL